MTQNEQWSSDYQAPSDRRSWWNLLWLSLIGLLSSVDIQLIYLLLQPIKRDLLLTDAQLGIATGTAVALVMATAAFPIGWAADRFGRRLVLGLSVLFWSVMTGMCGLAYSFETFLLASVGLALGEAGLYGIMYAMIPDIVREHHRNTANTVILGVLVFSGAIGLILGGQFLSFIESLNFEGLAAWRIVFFCAGAIGLIFAFLPWAIRPYKPQLRPSSHPSTGAVSALKFSSFLRSHGGTVAITFLAISLFSSAWGIWLIWSPSLLARSFGISDADAGQVIGWASLGGCFVSLVLANWLHRRNHVRLGDRFAIRILFYGCVAGMLPILFMWTAKDISIFIIAFFVETVCMTLALSVAPMLMQDIAPPSFRSRVYGLGTIVALPVRMIAAPGVGLISDSAGENGLLIGACIVTVICLVLSVLILLFIEQRYSLMILSIRSMESPAETQTARSEGGSLARV